MVEILGKKYYIDIDSVTKKCQTGNKIKNENGQRTFEIDIFKYEIIKTCIERILNEFEDPEEENLLGDESLSTSFKIAFNTLIKNEILIEEEDE
jgi:hypothetical protein